MYIFRAVTEIMLGFFISLFCKCLMQRFGATSECSGLPLVNHRINCLSIIFYFSLEKGKYWDLVQLQSTEIHKRYKRSENRTRVAMRKSISTKYPLPPKNQTNKDELSLHMARKNSCSNFLLKVQFSRIKVK